MVANSRGFEYRQERRGIVFLQGQLSVLLFRYLFHSRATVGASKRSQAFCQKCRWYVTAIQACTLRLWLCMK